MMKRSIKSQSGIILVDVLLGLSLGAIFIGIITESSLNSQDVFNRSLERTHMLDEYSAHEYSSRTYLYGNDRIETDMTASRTDTVQTFPSISFVGVKANSDISSTGGTPLCSADFTHGQKNDQAKITPIQLPVSQTIPLTDFQVRDGIVYVSANSSVVSDPDLFIFDIHDMHNPKLLSSINTGPGISAITLAGKRIYAAADSTASQLHIIRMDSLTSLTLEDKFRLPLPYATATPSVATSIFYDSEKVYLGTSKWDGDEFNAIDVSNPSSPSKLGGLETGTQLNALYVHGGLAYTASSDQNQLRIIDVHDGAHPSLFTTFSPSGWQRQEGQTVDMFEGALGFGRTSGGFDIATDHELFTWSTTSSETLINPVSLNNPGGIYGIQMDRMYTFVGSRQLGKEFQILGKSFSESSTTYPIPASVQAVTCDNDSIYVLGHSAPVVYQITF